MSDFAAAIAELNGIAVKLDTSGHRATALTDQIVIKTAHDIEAYAKQAVPVDTGATRSSIGTDIIRNGAGAGYGVTAEIGAKTSYAPFLEGGTERMAPRAFMGPAFDRYVGPFYAALEAVADPLAGP
jgi:HK97 gp10 family phage protein